MKARIEENVRKVNTMIHVISREHEHSLMADKYDIKESDDEEDSDEEDGDEGGEREEKDGFTTTDTDESRPQTPLGVQSSVAASTVLTTGGYLGDVAEGWDRKEEHRTRYRLYKSSSLVSPEAAMRTRPLDRAAIQRLLDKVDSGVAQEAEEVRDYEERMHSLRAVKRPATASSTSQNTLDMLEGKLAECIKYVFVFARVAWRGVRSGWYTLTPSLFPLLPLWYRTCAGMCWRGPWRRSRRRRRRKRSVRRR
jgi:hypothetical protein